MTVTEKLNLLENVLGVRPDTISENTELQGLDEWDSIAVITLIAMFDSVFGKPLTSKEIKEFNTAKDILNAMERGI